MVEERETPGILAVLLSAAVPGAGQIHGGALGRGLVILAVILSLGAILRVIGGSALWLLPLWLWQVWDAAPRSGSVPPEPDAETEEAMVSEGD